PARPGVGQLDFERARRESRARRRDRRCGSCRGLRDQVRDGLVEVARLRRLRRHLPMNGEGPFGQLCGGGPADPGPGGPPGPAAGGRELDWPGAGMLPKLTCGTARSVSSAWKKPKALKPSAPAISDVGRVCSLML